MADKYTSLMALRLDDPLAHVGEVVAAAREAGGVDRHAPVRDAAEAAEVFWGGRMQRAVVRRLADDDGEPLLRVEAYIGAEGVQQGLPRQSRLLLSLARQLGERVRSVRDLSADAEHDLDWLHRVAAGEVTYEDAVSIHTEGRGTSWVHTHGAARFDIPDLELYGLDRSQVDGAVAAIRAVHDQLLRGGIRADLHLPDGTGVYLVPVMEAWARMPLDWPGIGRAGKPREGDHDGPRATLSVLHKRRFGRYKRDFNGVLQRLRGGTT